MSQAIMIRSILQTVFYFYLIYDFYFNKPEVIIVLFSMWLELSMIILTFIILKFMADGFKSWDFLAGIVVTIIPVLLTLLLFVFMISENSMIDSSKVTISLLLRKTIIGIGLNHFISIFFFLKNRGTETDFMNNLLIKFISVVVILLAGFLVVSFLSNLNQLILVCSIIAARFIIEVIVNTNSFKKYRENKF